MRATLRAGLGLVAHSLLALLVASTFAGLARAGEADEPPSNADCFDCHGSEAAKDEGHAAIVHEKDFEGSGHSDLDCTDCHDDATEVPHDELKEVSLDRCTDCHEDQVVEYREGHHSQAREGGQKSAPTCASCHGDIHKAGTPTGETPVAHLEAMAKACAECHSDPELARANGLSVVRPVEAYLASAHARAIRNGERGAVCSDCHEPHRTLPSSDPRSSLWPATIPKTCGKCHEDVVEKFSRSVHGRALASGMRDAPGCTDCHGEHRILSVTDAASPVFATNVPRETCGRCHSDLRLTERHDLAPNFSAFDDSFHGLALRAGQVSAANCASCHGVHDVLPSSDPASSVHPDNLAATCAKCHPGAGERFAVGPVHVSATAAESGIESWVRVVYLWAIVLVVGGMAVHVAADLVRKARAGRHHAPPPLETGASVPVRMPRTLRRQHALVMVSFPVLVYSGFALTSPESWWAAPLLHWETTYAMRGLVHRCAAVVLMIAVAWHLGGLAFSARHRSWLRGMWWTWGDVRHLGAMLAHYAGRRKERPRSGRFSYIEKAEYWAFLWGAVLMAVTGLPLWFADWTLRHFPKWVTDVATAIHFYEALLATLAILVWHLYWTVFDPDVYPMDTSWWSGHAPPARNAERDDDAPPAADR